MMFLFICLTYFTQYDNICVQHVAANSIISFFFLAIVNIAICSNMLDTDIVILSEVS